MTKRKSQSETKNQAETKNQVFPMKWIREELGMSQMELATALGVSCSKLSAAETGKSEPVFTMKQVKILCQLTGKTVDEFPDYLGKDVTKKSKK